MISISIEHWNLATRQQAVMVTLFLTPNLPLLAYATSCCVLGSRGPQVTTLRPRQSTWSEGSPTPHPCLSQDKLCHLLCSIHPRAPWQG